MKATLLATGTQGDVQPYLALGRGLRQRGHDVVFVTGENYEQTARDAGLTFAPLQGDVRAVLDSPAVKTLIAKGRLLAIQRHASALIEDAAAAWARVTLDASAASDLLIAGIGGRFIARAVARRLAVPLIEAYVVPTTPTAAFPAPVMPAWAGHFGGWANRISYGLMERILHQSFGAAERRVLRELGMEPAPPRPRPAACPVLCGVSPRVVPRPPDWGDHVHLTGYWFLDPPQGFTPDPQLTAFLDAGPSPICFGFGSMMIRDPQRTADMIVTALERVGTRGVLLSGWGGLSPSQLPHSVFRAQSVPHAWLFGRVVAVVHHGGAGTTAACLRAGKPALVTPLFGDQPWWGRRIAALGCGPAPLPFRDLDPNRLTRGLESVLEDSTRRRAAVLGTKIRQEDGIGNAVTILERVQLRSGIRAARGSAG